MKFGELSDSFYHYYRKWEKDKDPFVQELDNLFLISKLRRLSDESTTTTLTKPPCLKSIRLNFRFFTKIMLYCNKNTIERIK